ncbi:Hypothetical predicted protein, partial [Mytilus galloprovincialis]
DGKTTLHYAAGNGHLQVTQWLIEKEGMDPLEMTSTVGQEWRLEGNRISLVKYSQGKTPYDFAAVKGEYDNEQIKIKKEQVMDYLKTVMIKENPDKILECDSVHQKGSTQNETQNIPPQRGVSSET